MNGKSEESSTDNTSNNTSTNSSTSSSSSSQEHDPQHSNKDGTQQASQAGEAPTETTVAQTSGEPSSTGTNSSWSYNQSEQYQDQYYPEYQYPQEEESYDQESYYQQSAESEDQYYQGEEYYNQSNYQYSEQQQQGQSQSQSQSQLNSEQQQKQNGEKLQEDQQQQGDKEGHERPHDQSQPSEVCSEQKQTVSNQTSGEKGKCWECGAAFQDDELLRDHLALFHAEVHVHKCHSCPAVFPSQSSLTEHITTSHLVGASIQSANRAQQRERKDSTEDQSKLQETPNKGKSISVSGSESLSSLLAKGISVSGGDHSLTSLQAKENSESSDSPLSSLKAKGISISGGNSSLSSLQAKGISISGGDSSLSSLQAKGISIGRSVGDSSLASLQTKGVSVSSGESPLKALHAKGISISSSGETSLTSLQAKGISISGSSDSSLSSLQAKGISISSGEPKGSGGDSSFSFLQSKGISISGASDSSLTSLQAKGISIAGADSSQSKGNSLSEGESPLSYLQSKGISISGAETSLQLKGVTKSGGDSPLSFLQGKGISISSADTSLQTKGSSLSSGASPLASLQAKGISISGTGAESSIASLKAKGISIAGADSSFLGKEDSASDNFSEEEEDSTASETDSQPASLHAKHFATVKSQVESLQGKSVSFSSASSPLSLLQGKGVSLSAASPQAASSQAKGVPSPSEVEGPSKSSDTATPTTETKTEPSSSHSLEVASLRAKGISLYSSGNQVKYFARAAPKSVARSRAAFIKEKGIVLSKLPDPRPKVTAVSGAKPKELLYRRKEYFGCVYCRIKQFRNTTEFEKHHLNHVKQTTLKVILLQVNPEAHKRNKVETRRKKKSSELKLKLRISKVGRGKGRKRREVRIVSNEEGMSESHKSLEEREGSEVEHQEGGEGEEEIEDSIGEEGQSSGETVEDQTSDLQKDSEENPGESSPSRNDCDEHQEELDQEEQGSQEGHEDHQKDQEEDSTAPPHQEDAHRPYNTRSNNNQNSNSNSGFDNNFSDQDLGFGGAGPSEAPPSTYQPQFESFPTSDWFSEYESGSRIVAAMAGATSTDAGGESGWGSGPDGTSNPEYPADGGDKEDGTNPEVNGGVNEGNGEDGLFSQAVLGQESPDKNDRQGSFEQLCLNDSYSGQAQNNVEGHPGQVQGVLTEEEQHQQQQQSGVASDLLSELEYLNNSGQPQGSHPGQVEGSPLSGGPSPHSGGPGTPSHLSSRGSNSGTPTSSGGHPTPPPTDTSFRALATSPMTSPTQATSPALMQGQTPPATSPLQQEQQQAGVPRLTIANNLMAPTTSSQMTPTTNNQAGVGGMMSRYGNQWPQGAGYTGTGGYANLSGTNMANSNMAGPLRAPLPPSVGLPYRPSPPARVRGRPPLMGQIGRPPLHQGSLLQPSRGPGRPPTSSILPPPLMPAPGGRGAMMPPLQRMHQGMYQGQRPSGPQQQNGTGKRPLLGATSHSPNKNARREDINVPSRQKDNECQIIAVANRADGLPVIANVQGGSGSNQRGSTTPTTSESTINLSDSITLSVRTSSANDKPQRGERGGADAGTVANLLASRGITVTPAAGERQEGAGGGRDDRRLPTAQELNLSSAISVHPPTQREREASVRERDRDGFAVPQAPVRGGSSNANNVERPPRPPTVDLTQDVPSSGSQSTRHFCNQCDRSFPTAGLLADHSRVHQQHTQSRMPYKCHLCTAGFSTQKGQQHHYQQFHQIHLSAGDIAIPLVDLRNPVNVQRMAALGIRSFLPLTNLQNRGAGGVVGIPVLTLENLRNGHMTLQQWGVSDVLSLGPAKTLNMPR